MVIVFRGYLLIIANPKFSGVQSSIRLAHILIQTLHLLCKIILYSIVFFFGNCFRISPVIRPYPGAFSRLEFFLISLNISFGVVGTLPW
jgi:hypothetical protein